MTPLFKKLNWKDQAEIVVLNAPESFEAELAAMPGLAINRDATGSSPIRFAIAFVTTLAQVEAAARAITPRAEGDAVVWFAYPKGTSKRFRCEFNRDNGWRALGEAGFEGVRQVAIDDDWSALRFRRVAYIKNLTRDPSRAASDEGRQRTRHKPTNP